MLKQFTLSCLLKNRWLCLAAVLIYVALPQVSEANERMEAAKIVTGNPWQFDFEGARGISLSYQGVPIIRQSSLYVVKPGWTGMIYDSRQQKYQVTIGVA